MTTELPGEPAELLSSVFGEQHWQWNCKWSWKCRNNRRLIGSKSCTFRLSGLLCLHFFTGDNKYNQPTHPQEPKKWGAPWSASLKSRCVFAYDFCQRFGGKIKHQPPADTFCFLCCFIGWSYLYSHFWSGYILFILKEVRRLKIPRYLVSFDSSSYY